MCVCVGFGYLYVDRNVKLPCFGEMQKSLVQCESKPAVTQRHFRQKKDDPDSPPSIYYLNNLGDGQRLVRYGGCNIQYICLVDNAQKHTLELMKMSVSYER